MDHQSRSGVCEEKRQRDRLIRLAVSHPRWVLGYQDEVWWSRFEQPSMHSWTEEGRQPRLVQQSVAKEDKDPKALACYGLLVRLRAGQEMWLRFVEGRPVSGITTQFLDWCCEKLEALDKTGLLMVWDNASWHKSKQVRDWIREHNLQIKESGKGVRILPCLLPAKSPWLNPIEPKWVHGKRRVVEPDGLLTARVLEERVCQCFGCAKEDRLSITQQAA